MAEIRYEDQTREMIKKLIMSSYLKIRISQVHDVTILLKRKELERKKNYY